MSAHNQRRQSARLNPPVAAAPSPPVTEARRRGTKAPQRRSKARRVDKICQFMRQNDISLREFILVYATTQGSGGYGERPATRAKRLAEAMYGQPEVLDALRGHPTSSATGIVTVKALRKEMKELEETGGMFSAYQVDHQPEKSSEAGIGREEQSEGGRKPEDYERILSDMQFGQMYEQVQTRAPLLCGLLKGLMAPKMERKDRPPRDPSKFNHRTALITSILCYSRAAEGSNKFPRVFGAFLYSNGVKRRILDLLHQFGLCEGYKGAHKHLETVAEQAKASSQSLRMDVD
ncbi:hypothetical protein EDB80DRAFT_823041 [Ilyonectria destructans]|nr:hypothetical protein EDB80DRAFT_823041 [Ilyonectria destructans]